MSHVFQAFWRVALWARGLWELGAIAVERITGVQLANVVRVHAPIRALRPVRAVFAGAGVAWALYEGITGKTVGL